MLTGRQHKLDFRLIVVVVGAAREHTSGQKEKRADSLEQAFGIGWMSEKLVL